MSSYLRLWWPGRYLFGFRQLRLDLMSGGQRRDSISALSGFASRQYESFINPVNDSSGSGRPIPEGVYSVGAIEQTRGSFGEGIGHWWCSIDVMERYRANNRANFGIHDDANREYAMGSAGCVVTYTTTDLERIEGWLEQKARPTQLVVDWGIGFLRGRGFDAATMP